MQTPATRLLISWAAAGVLSLAAAGPTLGETAQDKPFFDATRHQTQYFGPDRETPPPATVDRVLIGYFGPTDARHPDAPMWRAAQRAVDRANRQGGYQGKPFRLVPAWSENPWAGGVKQLAQLVWQDRVWAIVSGVDGPTAHLAEQVSAKARLPVVNAISTDKTVNLANVPWIFSLAPGDQQLGPVLAAAIVQHTSGRSFAVLSADDHDSRQLSRQLAGDLKRYRASARHQYQFHRGSERLGTLISEALRLEPTAVVILAGPDDSARAVTCLRQHGFSGTIFGGPAMGRHRFLEPAGKAAVGVVFPWLGGVESQESRGTGCDAATGDDDPHKFCDYGAAMIYDAVCLVVDAIRMAGLNRARVRDAMAELSPWRGVAGTVKWDGLGRNTRDVRLGTVVASPTGITWTGY